MPDALFAFFANYPFAEFLSGLTIIIAITFFMTLADSGGLVTATIEWARN
ncbi:MAG: BCCT family transporter [Sphingomonadaceae bacterium]